MAQSDYQAQPNLALAAVAAALAQTLGEQDPAFVPRLTANIEKTYLRLRDSGSDTLGALEALRNLQELLK